MQQRIKMTGKNACSIGPLKRKSTSNMKNIVSSPKMYIGYTLVHHVQLQKTREMSVENTGRPKRVGQESKPKCNAMRTKHACPL